MTDPAPASQKMTIVVQITFDRPIVREAKPRKRHVRIGTAKCVGEIELTIDLNEVARRVGGKALSFKRGHYSVLKGAIKAVKRGEPVEVEVRMFPVE